ncbi:MAG: hypothetical protein GC165_14105 [Armatimonadetes bacterium]|nr:hypothetical protein [Armatimonadota bacterium]
MVPLVLLLLGQQSPSLDTLTSLAKQKDIAGLAKYSTGDGHEFKVLRGGAYDVGKFGWTAKSLKIDGIGDFVVFTTPLTSEDIGELLFERAGTKLKYIDEQDKDGIRLRHHKVHVSFNVAKKEAFLTDEISAEISPNQKKFHLLRFSPCYTVSSITDGGKAVPFKQTGGIVMIPKLKPGNVKLNVTYTGIVNLPDYAGSITPEVITLTNDYWYPMANRMPATYEISVVPPSNEYTVVAQGNYVGKDGKAEKFDMELPAIYWSLTVLKTKHVAEKIDGRTLQMWSPRVSVDRMKLQPKLYAPIIDFYSRNFAPFPFDSYGALDSPSYGGGALEAYSYATYGGGLPEEDAHEPSHTWWGGIMPNTYLKSFWNESFADWSEGCFRRGVAIGNTDDRKMLFQTVSMPQEDYNEAPLMASGASIGAAAGSLGYGKGALVLAMLEQLVGTQNLVGCMHDWIANHPKGEPAEWEGFEAVVLKKLPQFELKDFFNDWFRRPGYANVKLASGSFAKGVFSGKLAWSGPTFRMPVDLWFEDASGRREVKMLDTKNVDPQGNFKIEGIGVGAKKVYFDPYHRALRVGPDPIFASFGDFEGHVQIVRDAKHPEYLQSFTGQTTADLSTLDGKFLIGNPATMPELKSLCDRAGFQVDGDQLTFDGTIIDLKSNAAVAVVELGGGKRCLIGLGVSQMPPNIGHGYVGLVDNLGRALRGQVHFPLRPDNWLAL